MDYITYCADTAALIAEIDGIDNSFLNEEKDAFLVDKIPTHRDGNETLCLVRAPDPRILELSSLTILGQCVDGEYVFDSPDHQATYERVRGPLTEMIEAEGKQVEVTKPYMIGVFA